VPTSDHATRLVADLFAYPAHFAVIVGVVGLVARSFGARASDQTVAKGIFGATGVVLILLTAITWSRAGAYADASELWNDTIGRNPKSYLAHYELGTLLLDDGATLYQQANQLRVDGFSDDAAEASKQSDTSFSESAALLETARTLRPDSTRAAVALGIARYRQGKFDTAEGIFREVLVVAPNDARANFNMGRELMRKYDDGPHLIELARLLQFERSLPTVTEWVYRRFGDPQYLIDAASEHFRRAAETDPTLGEAMYEKGMVYRKLGDDENAVRQFQRAVAVKPNYAAAHRELSRVFRSYGQYRESLYHLTQVYRLSPTSAQLQAEMGNAVGLTGNFLVAKDWFLQALALQADNPDALRGLKMVDQVLNRPSTTRPATGPVGTDTPGAPTAPFGTVQIP